MIYYDVLAEVRSKRCHGLDQSLKRFILKYFSLGLALVLFETGPILAQSTSNSIEPRDDPSEGGKYLLVEARETGMLETTRFFIPTHRTILEAKHGAHELRRAKQLSGMPQGQAGVCLAAIDRLVAFQVLLGKEGVRELENWNYDDLDKWRNDVLDARDKASSVVEIECQNVLENSDIVIATIVGS